MTLTRCSPWASQPAQLHAVARVEQGPTGSNPTGDVMPNPCSVCVHPSRADIDRRLAAQVVNVSALSREFGLNRNAVSAHRLHHLPDFLVALTARAQLPHDDVINAELQRLYLTSLDALARAEAGTLVQIATVDGEPVFDRIWSPTAVARLIGEARKGLGMISALVAARENVAPPAEANASLDASIARALDRFEQRSLGQPLDPPIADAVLVADSQDVTSQGNESAAAESKPGVTHHYPGVDATARGGHARSLAEDPFTVAPTETYGPPEQDDFPTFIEQNTPKQSEDPTDAQKRAADLYLAGLPPEVRKHIAEVLDQHEANDQMNPELLRRPWAGNPGASIEERAFEGYVDGRSPIAHPLDHPSGANPATDRTSRRRPSSDPNLPPAGRRA